VNSKNLKNIIRWFSSQGTLRLSTRVPQCVRASAPQLISLSVRQRVSPSFYQTNVLSSCRSIALSECRTVSLLARKAPSGKTTNYSQFTIRHSLLAVMREE